MPLGIAVVDASIIVFGLVFPRAAVKHRAQMLEHFAQHLKVSQNRCLPHRAEAVNANIYAAVLASLKGLVDTKAKTLGNDEVKRLAVGIINSGLVSTNASIRCTAAECLGRLAQVILIQLFKNVSPFSIDDGYLVFRSFVIHNLWPKVLPKALIT